MPTLPPLTFAPILKQIRWGGRRLGDVLGKPIGDASDYAESWELVDHGDDQSVVIAPPDSEVAGWTLASLVQDHAADLFGVASERTQFPLLIKFLDASDRLSVQVHPDDMLAKQFDPVENGKTEAWVILDAEPGAVLYAGLKEGVTESELRDALAEGTVETLLHTIEVKAGDCVFIPAGTIHAIGEGVLLAEVQQASDMTFRLYDWGRLGADGEPRPLHIEESIRATDWQRGPVDPVVPDVISDGDNRHEHLVACEFFQIDRLTTKRDLTLPTSQTARVLIGIEGEGTLASDDVPEQKFGRGRTILIPANCTATIRGAMTFLDVAVPIT